MSRRFGKSKAKVNLKLPANAFIGTDSSGNENFRLDNDSSIVRKGDTVAYGQVEARKDTVTLTTQTNASTASTLKLINGEISMNVDEMAANREPDFRIVKSGSDSAVSFFNNETLKVYDKNGTAASNPSKPVFVVDTMSTLNDDDTSGRNVDRGGVYIRRGVVSLESNNQGTYGKFDDKFVNPANAKGYVQADMLVSQKTGAALSKNSSDSDQYNHNSDHKQYDIFMVNPAYTSVMHDIKLTTRGGARLSDILPDFINKGIYIVDNTFKENSYVWPTAGVTPPAGADGLGGNNNVSIGNLTANSGANIGGMTFDRFSPCGLHDYSCKTSPFVGVVPTPQCPPGYKKVIQVIPYGFNMAQAGTVVRTSSPTTINRDSFLMTQNDPKYGVYDPADVNSNPIPFTFQKNTRLRTIVRMESSGKDFLGWSVLLGFIYPGYSQIFEQSEYNPKFTAPASDDNVIWNLFPVYYRELEAYANIYCYFARNNVFSSEFVDTTYDQLNNYRKPRNKGDTPYIRRLNDPNMNYNNPW